MPTIIVENDISQWNDVTGEVYHFPKRYKNLLLSGEKVIYYKSKIKDKSFEARRLSNSQHYFGVAEIGDVITINNGKELQAEIINFRPFISAVYFKQNDQYLEKIPTNKEKNYWRDGVRSIDENTYNDIIALADLGPILETKLALSSQDNQKFESGVEGKLGLQVSSKYERDPRLRKAALAIHGYTCAACDFNFEEYYGEYGKGFIHIHHIEPLFLVGEQSVNPETDLVPLCANCHALVHRRRNQTLTVDDIKKMIHRNKS